MLNLAAGIAGEIRRHPRLWAWWVPVFVVLNGVLGFWFVADYKNVPHRSCTHLGDLNGVPPAEAARHCWLVTARLSHGWLLSTDPDVIFLVAVVINALLIAVAVLRWKLYEAQPSGGGGFPPGSGPSGPPWTPRPSGTRRNRPVGASDRVVGTALDAPSVGHAP